jgi:hypothetical protein
VTAGVAIAGFERFARMINRCAFFRCDHVLRLWDGMVAHDQDSVGNPAAPLCIVVGILDDNCAGQSKQGLGFTLAVKVRVIPVESRRLITRYRDLVGVLAGPVRLRPALRHEICRDHIVARRNARTAGHRLNFHPMKVQIGVPGRVVIAAGPNVEVAGHVWNARKVGCVAGRRCLSQNGCVIDAVE